MGLPTYTPAFSSATVPPHRPTQKTHDRGQFQTLPPTQHLLRGKKSMTITRGIRFLVLFCISASVLNFFYLAHQQQQQHHHQQITFQNYSNYHSGQSAVERQDKAVTGPKRWLSFNRKNEGKKPDKAVLEKKHTKKTYAPTYSEAVMRVIMAKEQERVDMAQAQKNQQQQQRKLHETPRNAEQPHPSKNGASSPRGFLTRKHHKRHQGLYYYNQFKPNLGNTINNHDDNDHGNKKKRGFFKGRTRHTETSSFNEASESTIATTADTAYDGRFVAEEEDPLAPLQYAPQRIPGYINLHGRDTLALYGFVMRDFTNRICSRQITSSHILVVSPDAPSVVQMLSSNDETSAVATANLPEEELRRQVHHTVGGSTLIKVHKEGHAYHGLNYTTTENDNSNSLDDWWRTSFDNNHAAGSDNPNKRPSWILLTMIDHGYQNDAIVRSAMTSVLKEATATYVVVGIGSYPSTDQQPAYSYGYQAIQDLIALKYKVQLLSLSHMSSKWYHTVSHLYRPNADLTNHTLDQFFQGLHDEATKTGTPVLGYVFATQGLDLAIPTATEYSPTIRPHRHEVLYQQCPRTGLVVKLAKRNGVPFLSLDCNGHTIPASNATDVWLSRSHILTSEAMCARAKCGVGGGEAIPVAACTTRIIPQIRHLDDNQDEQAPHTDNGQQQQQKGAEEQRTQHQQQQPNLLVLMIDPISRQRFERSLIKTNRLIRALNFTSFSQYTAVGNNSGPNQAALYSGVPLPNRESIAQQEGKGHRRWLWETLKDNKYATFKAEDGCVENSNMIQSIRPKVDHGDALQQMMCYDFQRPNCVGQKPAAEYLLDYGRQFMQSYSRSNSGTQQRQQPWAAMMHFIDSHEDTMTLEGTLDEKLWRFLYSIYNTRGEGQGTCLQSGIKTTKTMRKQLMPCNMWDNTMIVLISDHGLHYGSYLMAPKGLQERSQPMLHMHLPHTLSESARTSLEANKDKWTTPFDVYETILDVLVLEARKSRAPDQVKVGSTLLEPLARDREECNTTAGIPQYICDIVNADQSRASSKNIMMPNPPSVMSFYADIPHINKQVPKSCQMYANTTLFKTPTCLCATNKRKWHECTAHPWSSYSNTSGETFAMVDCGSDRERSYEINVKQDPKIIKRTELAKAKKGGSQPPNILVVELDSVSRAYADRHFPRTRELLNGLRLERNDAGDFRCGANDTLCSADFSQFSVVGASSIPNQVAALGGCIVTTGPEVCEKLEVDGRNRTICTDDSHLVFGMQLVSDHKLSRTFCRVDEQGRSPWIFDIAKSAGMVTLFAEEFCYDGSVYVSQGNIFNLDADILPHEFFCRNIERRVVKEGVKVVGPIWHYEDASNPLSPCVDNAGSYTKQKVAIDHISTMWDAYPDTPKFAFLNAMAAHVYGKSKTMASASEAYDLVLSKFLKAMLSRSDADRTIIVVRADHGLQAGPQTPDYSIQTEAFRPWTEVVVPKSLSGVSLEKLYQNQQRLATGYDLYRTLTSSIVGADISLVPGYSDWMFHLWKDDIPQTRSCSDAKILSTYCIYENARTITSPNLKTCNMVEPAQRLICPLYNDEFHNVLGASVDGAFATSKIQAEICPARFSSSANNSSVSSSLREEWNTLDQNIVNNQDINPTKGKMYLYPRQASILTGVVKQLGEELFEAEQRHLTVCQTGFDGGHTTALFLEASPYTTIHAFDKLDRKYHQPAIDQLKDRYGTDRLVTYNGEPCYALNKTLWPFPKNESDVQCDFLHGASRCPTDNIALVKRSPCGVILTSTAMSSLRDPTVYFGSDKGHWATLRQQECIRDIKCFEEDSSTGDDGQEIASSFKFCMAVTTGNCQEYGKSKRGLTDEQCETKIAEITERIQMSYLCPAHETPIPAFQAAPKHKARMVKKRSVVNKNWAKQVSVAA